MLNIWSPVITTRISGRVWRTRLPISTMPLKTLSAVSSIPTGAIRICAVPNTPTILPMSLALQPIQKDAVENSRGVHIRCQQEMNLQHGMQADSGKRRGGAIQQGGAVGFGNTILIEYSHSVAFVSLGHPRQSA